MKPNKLKEKKLNKRIKSDLAFMAGYFGISSNSEQWEKGSQLEADRLMDIVREALESVRKETEQEMVDKYEIVKIPLTGRAGQGKFAIIDRDDYKKVSSYRWVFNDGYVINRDGEKSLSLHRFIMNPPANMVVDHINHDGLDNRKSNLRICTQYENHLNRYIQKNNTSGFMGVNYHKPSGLWRARLKFKGKYYWLGEHKTFEEAVEARRQGEKEVLGKLAQYVSKTSRRKEKA